MRAFDAPNRSVCTAKRSLTNTPMQALVLLNDPQFIEASQYLAKKMIAEEGNLDSKIKQIFRQMIGKSPSGIQIEELIQLFEEEKNRFSKDPKTAEAFLSHGQYPFDKNFPKADWAAMTVVVNTLMNFDGFYTKR